MDTIIRDLRTEDLANGFLDSLTSLTDVGLTPEEARGVMQTRQRAGVRTYVALLRGRVAGTASLVIEQKFIHRGGRIGHIEDVAVHRDFQGHGIGSALVQHATTEARKLGCYKVILSCFEDRVPFYSRLGFRRHDIGMRMDL
jgi:glucosamine-phosphate N-acetyltransferase